MMTKFLHYNDVTDAAGVRLACSCLFFYLSHRPVRVFEIELSHMTKNNGNSNLVCENFLSRRYTNILLNIIFYFEIAFKTSLNILRCNVT